ncbi:Piso0_002574 [Millerozyma farinosa CBS 7064]|uniref:Piso0_002574 protein n=1 Tax=Pichia sorbitophila (strain ATCC MYA-4447 / BCRC 22081 / CBS 7064 / NBRC 10061 / NRRL Y-12695) TaxID=559304 RepID=G8YCZ3_PICSO|nr:Piso0_002574 [Millerozyma farinosa CBS 7064]
MLVSLSFHTLFYAIPYLMSLKVLIGNAKSEASKREKRYENMEFLLSYWVCYAAVCYFESLLPTSFVFSIIGIDKFATWFFSSVKLWLFYWHGCLLVNNFYLGSLFISFCSTLGAAKQPCNSFEYFEKKLVNPLMRFFFINNQTLFYASTYAGNMFDNNDVVSSVSTKLLTLQRILKNADKENESLIDTVMDQTCYMDSEEDLKVKFTSINDTFRSQIRKALECILRDMRSDSEYPLKELQLMHRKENRCSLDGRLLSDVDINSQPGTKTNYISAAKDNTQRVTEFYNLHTQWLLNPRYTGQISSNKIHMEPSNVKRKVSDDYETEKNSQILTNIDSYNKGVVTILNPYVTSKSLKSRKLKKIGKKLSEEMMMVN